MTRRPTAPKRKRQTKKREPSPTCFDTRQTDLVDLINRKAKSEGFAKLDAAIAEAMRKDGWE